MYVMYCFVSLFFVFFKKNDRGGIPVSEACFCELFGTRDGIQIILEDLYIFLCFFIFQDLFLIYIYMFTTDTYKKIYYFE